MPVRSAQAEWKGDLRSGSGTLRSETGAVEGQYSFSSRFEEGVGTNPEELIAAAHAGCFSMAFANILAQGGHPAESVRTSASVHLEKGDSGFGITRVVLTCRATVPGIDAGAFQQAAEQAKAGCPVSRALAAIRIELDAALDV